MKTVCLCQKGETGLAAKKNPFASRKNNSFGKIEINYSTQPGKILSLFLPQKRNCNHFEIWLFILTSETIDPIQIWKFFIKKKFFTLFSLLSFLWISRIYFSQIKRRKLFPVQLFKKKNLFQSQIFQKNFFACE